MLVPWQCMWARGAVDRLSKRNMDALGSECELPECHVCTACELETTLVCKPACDCLWGATPLTIPYMLTLQCPHHNKREVPTAHPGWQSSRGSVAQGG